MFHKSLLYLGLTATLFTSCKTVSKKESFEIGEKTFLLNNEPFIIKAAELHYPRIPREYWEHRIQMCKALGMNTICLYVFWNLHEEKPGEFDFSGNKDLAAFCKLAQDNGMYVIVRPGPYVCAEWEMGGLPWWLLKNKDVKLRSLDPYYMERVAIFMKEVGRQIGDLQISQGGNVLMVQVENEFGSYGTDKPYVSAIRDIVRESGFTDVPLFQCDWSSNFTNNALEDLLWTVNFGTGADIDSQFAKLKELRPNTPLMCSEFWSGWFDHWGRKHETRDSKVMVQGLRDMLDRHISFSLYMTHGGTTFGHWGGANNPAYSAMCSSYDYDAPISEAGWATPKYFELRDMLKEYLPQGAKLPEVPASMPVISIPEIEFNQSALLFENLPEVKLSENIQPMEQFDQGWGSILYRTQLPAIKEGSILRLTEAHDWTQVFINNELIGTLDRRKGEQELVLPALPSGVNIDILVEAMGRVNFDKSIHDRKGITDKVELIEGENVSELKNWQVFNIPVDYSFVSSKNYQPVKTTNAPAFYKTTFHLDEVGDTFIDMSTWGKGLVWVNGKALGRFWEIGPQQTLYMPGCWLKKGMNEIIVFDIKGPAKTSITGLEKPILDVLKVDVPQIHREEKENLNLQLESAHYKGTFKQKNGWQTVRFKPNKGRYFCLQALSSYKGDNIASIAEFDVLDKNGKAISREHWKIRYANSEETRSGNRTADKIFDLQESTFWQTVDNTSYPHQIVIDLSKEYEISGFRYLSRAEGDMPGLIRDYEVFVKIEDFNYHK